MIWVPTAPPADPATPKLSPKGSGRLPREPPREPPRERAPSEVQAASDWSPLLDPEAGRALLAHCWARKATVAVATLALAAAAAMAGAALAAGGRNAGPGGGAASPAGAAAALKRSSAGLHAAASTTAAAPATTAAAPAPAALSPSFGSGRNATAAGRNATAAASGAAEDAHSTTAAPAPAPPSLVRGKPYLWPVNAVYVISMPDRPERLKRFKQVLEFTTGVPGDLVEVSPGVNAEDAVRNHAWPLELLPGLYTDFEAGHVGNVGCGLAHMSAWKRVQDSPRCQADGAADEYALIFEDDEWVKGVLPAALRRLMQLVESSDGPKPDFINLNVIRPTGEAVPDGESLLSGSYVLRVKKGKGHAKCWDPADTTCPNTWLGAYLVRCGGASRLIEGMQNLKRGGKKFDGTLSFDRAMSDMLLGSPPASEAVAWVVGPNNSFTVHSEQQSSRKELNGGLAN